MEWNFKETLNTMLPDNFCLLKEDVIELITSLGVAEAQMDKDELKKLKSFDEKLREICFKKLDIYINECDTVESCSLDELGEFCKKD